MYYQVLRFFVYFSIPAMHIIRHGGSVSKNVLILTCYFHAFSLSVGSICISFLFFSPPRDLRGRHSAGRRIQQGVARKTKFSLLLFAAVVEPCTVSATHDDVFPLPFFPLPLRWLVEGHETLARGHGKKGRRRQKLKSRNFVQKWHIFDEMYFLWDAEGPAL